MTQDPPRRDLPSPQRDPAPAAAPGEAPLPRAIGSYTATMIVIGSMIGSGIFKKPPRMAAQLPSAPLLLLTWVLAGGVTFFGALSNAEIASLLPAVRASTSSSAISTTIYSASSTAGPSFP